MPQPFEKSGIYASNIVKLQYKEAIVCRKYRIKRPDKI